MKKQLLMLAISLVKYVCRKLIKGGNNLKNITRINLIEGGFKAWIKSIMISEELSEMQKR